MPSGLPAPGRPAEGRSPRRSRLRALAALALVVASCAPVGAGEDPLDALRARPARSAVVVVIDTLRADHLGCYGYERATSPRLDALAADGLLFENAVAHSSWTKPATASILTGRFPSEHGAVHPGSVLRERHPTLAELVRDAGLATAGFVTNQWVANPEAGMRRGFAHFVGYPGKDEGVPYVRATRPIDDAVAWIEERGEERFLAYLHLLDPHGPYAPPPPYDRRFGDPDASSIDGGYGIREPGERIQDLPPADLQRLIDLYDGEIAWVDAEVGRLLDALARLGRDADTAVVVLSDHGEEFGEHGGWRHGPQLHPEVVRVPLLVRAPALSERHRGVRHPGLVLQVDVAPTVLDLLGLPVPPELPGRSLLERAFRPGRHPALGFVEVDKGGTHREAVVTDEAKLVRQRSPKVLEELYDLVRDPDERRDVLARRPDVAGRLRSVLDAYAAANAEGLSVLVQSGADRPAEVEVRVETERPLASADLLYAESGPRFGERRDRAPRALERAAKHVVVARLVVDPGDGDGVRLVPAADETRVRITVLAGGHPVPAEGILLGPHGTPAASNPFELDRADAEALEAPGWPARADLAPGSFRVRVWRPTAAPPVELGAGERDALEALGYLGGN